MTLLPGTIPPPGPGRTTYAMFRVPVAEILSRGLRRRTVLRRVSLVSEVCRATGLRGGGVEVEWRWRASEVLRGRIGTVTGGGQERLPGKHLKRGGRRTLAEMCRLQGLPEDFLDDAPFTMDGKRKAIANGVPLPMGRAIAKAVRSALDQPTAPSGEGSP